MSAKLFQVGKNKIWHYRFQVAGKRIQRTTRLSIKRKAKEVADRAFEAAVIHANGGQPVNSGDNA